MKKRIFKIGFNLMVISGRRWFQKSYGNTYHKTYIEIRTKTGNINLQSKELYGYGEMYLQTAFTLLQPYFCKNIEYWDFVQYIRNNRQKFVETVTDVNREKEL